MTQEAATPVYTARESEFEAMVRLRRGAPLEPVIESLVLDGHPPGQAEAAVRKIHDRQVADRKRSALQWMLIGGICFVAGTALSLWVTFASSNSFLFTWGIVAYGLIQFIIGFNQWVEAKQPLPAPPLEA